MSLGRGRQNVGRRRKITEIFETKYIIACIHAAYLRSRVQNLVNNLGECGHWFRDKRDKIKRRRVGKYLDYMKFDETNYNLTQFVIRYSGCRKYLYKFGLYDSADCPKCEGTAENAEYIFFSYLRFETPRETSTG